MAIIDLQRNHLGIQSLVTQFANYAAAGRGAMLSHSDGYVYCVFARNYLDGVLEQRRLYMTRSNDNGVTWSAAIELSTGPWDDFPALIELSGSDHSSDNATLADDIGIVFTRGNAYGAAVAEHTILARFTFDKDNGTITSPIDPITTSPASKMWPSVVRTSTGFLICCLDYAGIATPNVYQYINTSFTLNAWSAATKTVFPTNEQPMSLSVKRLSNGHLAMVGAYRTSLDGAATANSGMANLPGGILRCDVGAFFSSDDGGTWTSVQNLTNYAGTPAFDLAMGIPSVASVDLQELSDGTVVVGYQEHTAPQFLSNATSLQLPTGTIGTLIPRYHAGKNALFVGADNSTNGGVFVFDLTAQSRIRIHTGSTPPIWTNDVSNFALSPDETMLAVTTTTGGLTILDISDPVSTNWTVVKELRTTSTSNPGARGLGSNNVSRIKWDGNDTIYLSYGVSMTAWGERYDISTDTLTLLLLAVSGLVTDFVLRPTKLVTINSTTIDAVSKTTGASLYHSSHSLGAEEKNIFYDSVNDEYVGVSLTILARITDNGSSFTEVELFTATSTPAWGGCSGLDRLVEIYGKGLVVPSRKNRQNQWYSFASKQPAGERARATYLSLGENADNGPGFRFMGLAVKNNTWLLLPGSLSVIVAQNLVNVGRIRYAYCAYDAGTKVITPGDFYDLCNINKVGTNMTSLQFPNFCADADDRLYWYFCRWDLLQPGGNEFAPVLGVVDPDSVKITMLARILRSQTHTFTSRSRIQSTATVSLSMRMRIVFAQCLKMKARIVPRQAATLSMRAGILGGRSNTCLMSFSVQGVSASRVRAAFYVNTGRVGRVTVTCRARIVGVYAARMTGHFLVKAGTGSGKLNFSVTATQSWPLTARARIAHG